VLVGFELIRQGNQANVPFRTGFITLQLGISRLRVEV